jgi:adenylate cyclase
VVGIQRALRSERLAAAIAGLLAALAVLVARSAALLEPLELAAWDRMLRLRPAPGRSPRAVVVAYTESDIQTWRRFPLDDGTLARVLERVLAAGPRAVGVDLYRDVPVPPGSEELDALLARDPRVVLIHQLGGEGALAVGPPPVLAGTDRVAFNDLPLDRDDTLRRALLYTDSEEGGPELSLALRVALGWLSASGVGLGLDPEDPELLRLGPTPLPRLRANDGGYARADSGGYQLLVDFDGAGPVPAISMDEVLRGAFEPGLFRDRMVFAGVTAQTHADLLRVPVGLWPGVFVHAAVAEQLVRYGLGEGRPLAAASEAAEAGLVLLFAMLGSALGLARAPAWISAPLALLGTGALGAGGWLALGAGLWLPVVPPALAGLGAAGGASAWLARREQRERAALMDLFARHSSPTVAEELWQRREEFMEGGRPRPRRQVVTVLFVDVKGFTSVAERSDPLGLTDWLNELMGALADEAMRHGGFVDDYFGDGMKADFGVPLPRETAAEQDADAAAAVRCALAFEARLGRLNAAWRERGLPTGALRVGIDTGPAVAGSIGSSDRLKYTVVGDTVNTAARIEGLDDSQHDFGRKPCRILVSERTHGRLGDAFLRRELGEFALKGKANRVRIYEVLGPNASTAPPRGAGDPT